MTNQTEHHAEAILRDAVPMGWMYARNNDPLPPSIQANRHAPQDFAAMSKNGWTETPLYPASAILDAVQAERAAIVAWLRKERHNIENWQILYDVAANAIERGEHLPQDIPQ